MNQRTVSHEKAHWKLTAKPQKGDVPMPDNILYGVLKENLADATKTKYTGFFKDRNEARKTIIGYNSINKDKNIKYSGMIVQMDPWKELGSFNEKDCRR